MLKKILPSIISKNQSAFVRNRLIDDNTNIDFETFHFINKINKGRKWYMGIKLDMTKAYDRLDWNLIHLNLLRLGFPRKIIKTILNCINIVSFSILINGTHIIRLCLAKGITQ